jgi:hypothetical protein
MLELTKENLYFQKYSMSMYLHTQIQGSMAMAKNSDHLALILSILRPENF